MEDNANNRYRLWFLLLYEDAENYDFNEVLFNLKSYKNYAYIKHDPEQEENKSHYHFLLKLDNACTSSSLSKKIGLPLNYIQNGKNERALCRYLIHADDDNKIQYNPEQVKCSRSYERFFKKQLDDFETEDEIIANIYAQIDRLVSLDLSYIKIQPMLIQWINANCYDTLYKRYRNEFQTYLTMSI